MPLRYLSADQLLADAQRLALLVLERDYHADLLIALWRGGTPIAIAMHEVFVLAKRPCRHTVIGASSYSGLDHQHSVEFTGMDHLPALLRDCSKVLVIDDVFDTGRTLAALRTTLHAMNGQMELRFATPWYKPSRNVTDMQPDFYLHSTEDWLVFPHELVGLDREQLLAKPQAEDLLARLAELPTLP